MTCPICGEKTKILETRADTDYIRRRRKCLNRECMYTFTTIEISKDLLDRIERKKS